MGASINNSSAIPTMINQFHLLIYSLILFFFFFFATVLFFQHFLFICTSQPSSFLSLKTGLVRGWRWLSEGSLILPPSSCPPGFVAGIRGRGYKTSAYIIGEFWVPILSVGCCAFLTLVLCCFPMNNRFLVVC